MSLTIKSGQILKGGLTLRGTRDLLFYIDANDPSSYSGGSTWNDISGNGHTVTLYNGAAFSTDGISFDYTQSQYADFGPTNMFFDDFTIITWVYIRSYQSWSRIIDFGNGAGQYNILLAATGGNTGQPVYSNVIGGNLQANTQVPLNQWVQLVAVQEGNVGVLYMNGQVIGRAINNGGTYAVTRNNNYIGRSNWEQDSYLDGKISSIKIYGRALRSSEILKDYHNRGIVTAGLLFNLDMKNYVSGTTWLDASHNHNDFEFFNSITPTVVNAGTNSAYWDNTAAYYTNAHPVGYATILPAGSYTKGALIRTDDGNTGTGNIFSSVNGIDVFWTNGGNIIQAGHNGDWSHVVGNTPIPTGQWVYVAVTFDTTAGWTLYQNGQVIGTNADATNAMGADSIPNVAGFQSSYGWTGKYAAAHEYTRALTQAEIQQNYNYYLSRYTG